MIPIRSSQLTTPSDISFSDLLWISPALHFELRFGWTGWMDIFFFFSYSFSFFFLSFFFFKLGYARLGLAGRFDLGACFFFVLLALPSLRSCTLYADLGFLLFFAESALCLFSSIFGWLVPTWKTRNINEIFYDCPPSTLTPRDSDSSMTK